MPEMDYEEKAGIPRWVWVMGLLAVILILAVVGALAMGLIGGGQGTFRIPGHTPPPH
jgi:hypothetical protein